MIKRSSLQRQEDNPILQFLLLADFRDQFQIINRAPHGDVLVMTARKKEEVPHWFILEAHLSLKLHLENSHLAFERVVRCGGLLGALDPSIASKHLDKGTQQWLLQCQGFNDKNHYERTTPCDQDTLRKAAKDVPAQHWMDWFNRSVQLIFERYGFFDPRGIFVGDGTYLFVPDNPAYEGSVVLWFDEHNHPVDYAKLSAQERPKAPPAVLGFDMHGPDERSAPIQRSV